MQSGRHRARSPGRPVVGRGTRPANRLAMVESTAWLEREIAGMSPEQQARARVARKAS